MKFMDNTCKKLTIGMVVYDDWDGFYDLDVDDGQPTEYDEWQSFDPDC